MVRIDTVRVMEKCVARLIGRSAGLCRFEKAGYDRGGAARRKGGVLDEVEKGIETSSSASAMPDDGR